jgi:Ca-activated chloride channel family protein
VEQSSFLLGAPLLALLFLWALWVRFFRGHQLLAYLQGHPGPEFWRRRRKETTPRGRWMLRGVLMGLTGLSLGVGLSGPITGVRKIPVRSASDPLILVLDVSRSMEVSDVPLGRLNGARLAARRVLRELEGVPVGLVVFAGEAHGLLPPSLNRELLSGYLTAVDPGMLSSQGTSLEGGLRAAVELLGDGGDGGGFLFLSDGEAHDGAEGALAMAREIVAGGGWISSLSLGTEEGGTVPLPAADPGGLRIAVRDAETEREEPRSRARPGFLGELARVGGGTFARGEDPAQVTELARWMSRWAEAEARGVELVELPREGWSWFVAVAVVGLLCELLLEGAESRRREGSWWREA